MGKNAYNGGSTIIYMPNVRRVLLRKIYESASDLLDEEFTLNFIAKVFNEYSDNELHNIEKDLSSISNIKRQHWINLIKKSFSNKSIFSKKKKLIEKNKKEDILQNIFKKENIIKKTINQKYKNPILNNFVINLEQLNLKIKNHPNVLVRERAQKEAISLQKKIDELIKLEELDNKVSKKKKSSKMKKPSYDWTI